MGGGGECGVGRRFRQSDSRALPPYWTLTTSHHSIPFGSGRTMGCALNFPQASPAPSAEDLATGTRTMHVSPPSYKGKRSQKRDLAQRGPVHM